MDDVVLYSVTDHVATVTINRPERRNSLSPEVAQGLLAALIRARNDEDVRVVVLTGAGDKAFCAGADLGTLKPDSWLAGHDARGQMAQILQAAYGLGKPLIAEVRGFALAGGFGLALMCDIVLAAEDAVFGVPEINVGMWPMMITVPMLRSMSPKVALELAMTGERVSAAEGHDLGFVTRVVPAVELKATVNALAAELATKSPALIRLGRDAFYRVVDQRPEDSFALLHASLELVMLTEDHQEGISSFLEKRPPKWSGR